MNNLNLINFNFEKLNNNFEAIIKFPKFVWKAYKTLNNFENSKYLEIKRNFDVQRFQIRENKRLQNFQYSNARIKILGIGGAGNNVLNSYLSNNKIGNKNIEFLAVNTEMKPLKLLDKKCPTLLLGTRGLGSGSDPENAARLTLQQELKIKTILSDLDLVILIAAIGKGTGTGSTPIIAKYVKEMRIPVLSLIFYPDLEGYSQQKIQYFESSLKHIFKNSDSVSIFKNGVFYKNHLTTFQSFENANQHLIWNLKNILSLSGCMYEGIDSCDFISFIKGKQKLSFHSLQIDAATDWKALEVNLGKAIEIYQIAKSNINHVIVASDTGILPITTNINRNLTNVLKSFFNDSDLNFIWGNYQSKLKTTTLSFVMGEPIEIPNENKEKVINSVNNSINEKVNLVRQQNIEANKLSPTQKLEKDNALDIGSNSEFYFNNSNATPSHSKRNRIDLKDGEQNTDDIILNSLTNLFKNTETKKIKSPLS